MCYLFVPFFLGPGKDNCFINAQKAKNVKDKIINLIRKINADLDLEYYILVFGEPDTRWYLGKGWYPWKRKFSNPWIFHRKLALLEAGLNRYLEVLDQVCDELQTLGIKLIIYGNTSVYEEQLCLARKWNSLLDKACQDRQICFLSVLDEICNQDGKIIPEYKNDICHASQKVIPLILKKLSKEHQWLDNIGSDSNILNHSRLKSLFEYNVRFGAYMEKRQDEFE